MINLYNKDCIEGMEDYPNNHFELAIVDPPYGIGTHCIKNNKNRTKLAEAKDYKFYANSKKDRPAPTYFKELFRVSKNQIIWGANHLSDLFNSAGSAWIVWNKEATGPFSDCEIAYSNFKCSAKLFTYQWNGMLQGSHGDKRKNEHRIHPSQKPVKLYEWLLKNYAKEGDKILDTHGGSMSIALACHNMGFALDLYEIDKDYFEAGKARLEQYQKQQRMFT